MSTRRWVKGDTKFILPYKLVEADGVTAVNLTNATVHFHARSQISGHKVDKAMSVTNAIEGECQVLIDQATDGWVEEEYDAECEATWALTGVILTWTNITVLVEKKVEVT